MANPVTADLGRRLLISGATCMALAGRGARAQPARRRYMVVSLLAERLHFVTARDSVGSNIDRNRRDELADQNRAFDYSALAALAAGIEAEDPGAHVDLISLPESPLHDKPDQLISGDSVVLPGHLVDALDKARSSHLLLVTKYRARAQMPVVSGSIGTGWLSGVGYYIDHSTPLRMADSGKTGTGFLAPYVHARLTLADANTGQVLRQQTLVRAEIIPVAADEKLGNAWEVLSPVEKIDRLRDFLRSELTAAARQLVAAL